MAGALFECQSGSPNRALFRAPAVAILGFPRSHSGTEDGRGLAGLAVLTAPHRCRIGAGLPPLRWALPQPVVVPADEPCGRPPGSTGHVAPNAGGRHVLSSTNGRHRLAPLRRARTVLNLRAGQPPGTEFKLSPVAGMGAGWEVCRRFRRKRETPALPSREKAGVARKRMAGESTRHGEGQGTARRDRQNGTRRPSRRRREKSRKRPRLNR